MVYADNVNLPGKNMNAIQKSIEAVLVTSKQVCLEGNEENTKYVCMAHEQNAGQNHIICKANKSLKM